MSTHIETKLINQLTIDTRDTNDIQPSPIILTIIDKHDPDTWTMSYDQQKIDGIMAILERKNPDSQARLKITIVSTLEPLSFARPNQTDKRQHFAGVLFVTANNTIKNMAAFTSEILNNGDLFLAVNSSDFWAHKPQGVYLKNDGNQVGFRFVIADSSGEKYYSNDPFIIARDWIRL